MCGRLKRNPLYRCFLVTLLLAASLLQVCDGPDTEPSYSATMIEGWAAACAVMEKAGASSLSLALVDGERVIWAQAFGMADKAAGRAATPDTLFGIGSVSKMFAAIAVMILVEKWNVSLDGRLNTYLSDFRMASPEYRDITVRMLLNHAAGFPGNDGRSALSSAPFTGYAAQVMEGLTYQRLKHAPGYLSVYSNNGFDMVENLVKAVTGVSYPQFVRDQILTSLGMVISRYATDYLPDASYAKTYYREDNEDKLMPRSIMNNVYASGGLYSSASDMARLAMMLINGGTLDSRKILSANSIDTMAQDQTLGSFNPLPQDIFRYGLGWDSVAQPGLAAVGIKAWQKGGDIGGPYGRMYGATLIVAPEERLGVVVMGASGINSELATEVAERIMLRAFVERGRLAAMPASLSQTPLPVLSPTEKEKAAFGGFYAASGALFRATFGADDSLTLDSREGLEWVPMYRDLKLRSDGWYAGDEDSITAIRFLTGSGRTYFALRRLFGAGYYAAAMLRAQKLETRPPVSDAWQTRLGGTWLYTNDDSFASFPDTVDDPRLGFKAIDGLSGYLFVGTTVLGDMNPPAADRLDGMFLQIPPMYGRDLADAAVERRENADWIRFGSSLLRPLSGVPLIGVRPTAVVIGEEGFAEWRKLPPAGVLSIGENKAWLLFDAAFKRIAYGAGSGSTVLPGTGDAAYLMLFGTPGATINLTLDAAP